MATGRPSFVLCECCALKRCHSVHSHLCGFATVAVLRSPVECLLSECRTGGMSRCGPVLQCCKRFGCQAALFGFTAMYSNAANRKACSDNPDRTSRAKLNGQSPLAALARQSIHLLIVPSACCALYATCHGQRSCNSSTAPRDGLCCMLCHVDACLRSTRSCRRQCGKGASGAESA